MNRQECINELDLLIQTKKEMIEDGTAEKIGGIDGLKRRIEALQFARKAIEDGEILCNKCEFYEDEDAEGDAWCYQHDRKTSCSDKGCPKHFQYREGVFDEEKTFV